MTVYEKIHNMTQQELALYLVGRDLACYREVANQLVGQDINVNLFGIPIQNIKFVMDYLSQDESEL